MGPNWAEPAGIQLPVAERVDRAQRLVPAHEVTNRGVERVYVEGASEADGHRDVVDRGLWLELVEEPHPLLRKRQRNLFRTRTEPSAPTRLCPVCDSTASGKPSH